LKNPNHDHIYSYIDRQVQNVSTDFEVRLQTKAERREMETILPQRIEELYRSIYAKYQDLKIEVARCATKENLHEFANAKVSYIHVEQMAI
jgi:hypothetical protein